MEAERSPTLTWSLGLRLVHWLDALVVLGLLGTVLLRKTFLSYRSNAALLQEKLAELDLEIAPDAAKAIARAIRAPMWQWHYYLGFALAVLFVYRLYLFFVRGENEILATSLLGRGSTATLRKRAYRTLHVLYYLSIAVMVVTGLALYFKESIGLTQSVTGSIKEIHELLTWFFVAFVPLHVVGAFVAECTDDRGVVSSMIHGQRSET
jgi:Ni/Fe-hydrogenase 1 B-type cytochrome subunit